MDVTEFMNYYITEIYVCNHDWLHQNIKCWRNHAPGGKWRWLLYDLDWGFSGELQWRTEDYTDNTFQWVQEQGEISLLFQKLMENEAFRFEFIQRFATHLNLTFQTDRVLHIIETMSDRISPEIPRQIERWDALRNLEYWDEQLGILKSFAINRPSYIREYLEVMYMLDGKSNLILEVSNEKSGWISVFDTPVPVPSYSGIWYDGMPIKIEAHAKPGWKFVEWIGDIQSSEAAITTGILGNTSLLARFEPDELPSVMLSEVHYNPSSEIQGEDEEFEFIELFNYQKEQVDLSGFEFTDGITFTFPQGSYIDPGEFILVASNPLRYDHSGAQCFQVDRGRLDNAGEILTLCDSENRIIDQVHYDDHYPWPREPDGDGPSLELISPSLDNALASSWRASEQAGGSPGYGHFTNVEEEKLLPGNELNITIFPNAFKTTTCIRYSLVKESQVSISIINMSGQVVDDLGHTIQAPGNHQFIWAPQNLSAGVYFIQFLMEGNMHIGKVIYLGE